jgi:DeoR/GlpR family transcriptional regulator of sugar metabolism
MSTDADPRALMRRRGRDVLSAIESYWNHTSRMMRVTVSELAELAYVSVRTARRALRELQTLKLVAVISRGRNGVTIVKPNTLSVLGRANRAKLAGIDKRRA